jgi:hypothetical protein
MMDIWAQRFAAIWPRIGTGGFFDVRQAVLLQGRSKGAQKDGLQSHADG